MAAPLSADRMLAVLRAEGLTVHEHTGWRTHGRDDETGKAFGPVIGVLIHHTAGHDDRELCFNGRPGLPGPLCHAWLGKTDGLWLLGNGRTNHAGSVDLDVLNALRGEVSPLPVDDEANADGNDVLYGLEIENRGNGTDPYPAVQYDEAVRWAAAICRAHGWSERSVAGHKEVQPGKVDPSFDMNVFRAAVAARLAHTPDWNPNEENDMALTTDELKDIAAAVWTHRFTSPTAAPGTDPTRAAADFLRFTDAKHAQIVALLAAQSAAIGALAAGGGLDAAEVQAAATAGAEAALDRLGIALTQED
jgi:hypothetical protein